MAYYRTCPECGSNLDPGEACECRRKKKRARPAATGTDSGKHPHLVYQPGRASSRAKEGQPCRKD